MTATGEFVDPPATREALMDAWEDGWARLFEALEPLSDADLARTVTIRGEAHSVMQAINRQVAHYSLHVGQIVMLAKHFARDRWQPLSVAKNQSAEFNRQVALGERSQSKKLRITQSKSGNSPCSTSSSPSPERIDEMSRGESPLDDENNRSGEISHCS